MDETKERKSEGDGIEWVDATLSDSSSSEWDRLSERNSEGSESENSSDSDDLVKVGPTIPSRPQLRKRRKTPSNKAVSSKQLAPSKKGNTASKKDVLFCLTGFITIAMVLAFAFGPTPPVVNSRDNLHEQLVQQIEKSAWLQTENKMMKSQLETGKIEISRLQNEVLALESDLSHEHLRMKTTEDRLKSCGNELQEALNEWRDGFKRQTSQCGNMKDQLSFLKRHLDMENYSRARVLANELTRCWGHIEQNEERLLPEVILPKSMDVTIGKMAKIAAKSHDYENKPLSYEWRQLKGPRGVSMIGKYSSELKLNSLQLAEYEFELVVTNVYHMTVSQVITLNVVPRPVIGIDLGTTYSCVATIEYGTVVPINSTEHESICIPSVIAFPTTSQLTKQEIVKIGLPAKESQNSIYDVKRIIGRDRIDPHVKEIESEMPFVLQKSKVGSEIDSHFIRVPGKDTSYNWLPEDERAKMERWSLEHMDGKLSLLPEQASALILAYLKDAAEKHFGLPVEDAVITVPAAFNDAQRKATKDAANIAGLNVLKVVNEPTAAAFAYGMIPGERDMEGQNVLVFDFGGGTLDVSVLFVKNSLYKVLAVRGNTLLGGRDFDNVLAYHITHKINRVRKIISGLEPLDEQNDKEILNRITMTAEKVKIQLSEKDAVTVKYPRDLSHMEVLPSGSGHNGMEITRDTFEVLIAGFEGAWINPVIKAINDANLAVNDISKVLLVGGSSKIPYVKAALHNIFESNTEILTSKTISPDLLVVAGAAHVAEYLGNPRENENGSPFMPLIVDVTPLPLGISIVVKHENGTTDWDYMKVVLPRNTVYPTSKRTTVHTVRDNQKQIRIDVFEGESQSTLQNHKVGNFLLQGLPEKHAGEVTVDVAFELDNDGILTVSANCTETGSTASIDLEVATSKGRMSEKTVTFFRELHSKQKFRGNSQTGDIGGGMGLQLYEEKKRN